MTGKTVNVKILETMVKLFDPSLPNANELWPLWLNNFEQSAAAAGVVDDKEKIKWMFYLGGKNLHAVKDFINRQCQNLSVGNPDKKIDADFNGYKKRLTKYFAGRRNIEKFRNLAQAKDEKFEDFMTRVRECSKLCCFYNDQQDEIKRQIATGAKYLAIRQKAFSGYSIDEIIECARKIERVEIKEVKEAENKKKLPTIPKKVKRLNDTVHKRMFCVRCGCLAHKGNSSCQAFNKICEYCGMKGHMKKCCMHRRLESEQMDTLAAQLSKDRV